MNTSLTAPPESVVSCPKEASPKRRQIVDAAKQLFLAHGYGAVSMDAVARTAGVSKATLYAYFDSKDQLFATIVRERGLNASLDERLFPDHVTDLRAEMTRIGQGVLNFMLLDHTLSIYRIVIAESARFPELGLAFYTSGPQCFLERVCEWLSVQQTAGLVRPTNLKVATEQFMALLRSGVFLRATLAVPPAPSDAEIDATVTDAVDTWLRAFAA